MKYAFSEFSVSWLKENGFGEDDIDAAQEALNMIDSKKSRKEERIRLPKNTNEKVSALVYLLDSITDADGRPICFEENGLIDIPDEARTYFEDDLELEQLERITTKLGKVKFSRRFSYPRRRDEKKQERSPPI